MFDYFSYIAIFLLILCSAFFSSTEIAYASINITRLKSKRQETDGLSLELAIKIAEDYDNKLGAILIGNNLANTASSAIATLIVMQLGLPSWVATMVMTLLVLIFGEIIPKVLAKQMAEQFCLITAIPIYILSVILKPVSFIVMAIVKVASLFWKHNLTDTDSVSQDDFENIIDIVDFICFLF